MKNSPKIVISSVLSLFILAGNLSFVSAVPFPDDPTLSPNPNSDSALPSIVDHHNTLSNYFPQCNPTTVVQNETTVKNPGCFNPNTQVISSQMYYPDKLYTQCPSYTQQTISYTTQIQPKFVSVNEPLPSVSLLEQKIVQKPVLTLKLKPLPSLSKAMYINQDFNSPAECFKPFKNQDHLTTISNFSTNKKFSNPNISTKKIIDTEAPEKFNIDFDQAFTNISNYVFDSSFTSLKNCISKEMLDEKKYFTPKTRNQIYLNHVKSACFKNMEYFTLSKTDKDRLKKFLDLSTSLDNNKDNICILFLIYSQILKLQYPHNAILSESIHVASKCISEKLEKMYSIKLKNENEYPNLTQHISRIYDNQKYYIDIYHSITENIFKNVKSPQEIFKAITVDPYLN